jgi:hypothetical protein
MIVAVLLLLNLTEVVPVKPSPLMVTGKPMEPLAGDSDVMDGFTVNVLALVPVPPELVTVILPVDAPEGTGAVILVEELTTKFPGATDGTGTPLNATPVMPTKLVPLMVTEVPTVPLVGENELTVGTAKVTLKAEPLVPVPPEVVTVMAPEVAVEGTVVVICESVFTVKLAETPLNFTEVAPVNLSPVRTTEVPESPLVGVNEVTVGPLPRLM